MNLLGARLYDPAVAVTRATSALLAMTALDTTNLQLSVTVPAHGMLLVRMRGVIHGATTAPQILLGVLNNAGGAVLGRVAPRLHAANMAATSLIVAEADLVLTGLTPGATAAHCKLLAKKVRKKSRGV
jgi:hypothetical protein